MHRARQKEDLRACHKIHQYHSKELEGQAKRDWHEHKEIERELKHLEQLDALYKSYSEQADNEQRPKFETSDLEYSQELRGFTIYPDLGNVVVGVCG